MGRARSRNKGWPEGMIRPPGRLMIYCVTPAKKWIPLGRTEAEAFRKYYEIKAADGARRKIHTIADLIDAYIREVVPTRRSKHTARGDLQCSKGLRAGLGHIPVTELRPMHCYEYQAARAKKARTRANRELAALSSIMRFAVRLGLRDDNPTLKVERLREERRKRSPEAWELAEVMASGNPMIRAYILIKVLTGLRQGDMLALRRDQIDKSDEGGLFHRVSKADNRERIMGWSDELRAAVAMAEAVQRPVHSLYLFATRTGQQYTADGFRSIWHRAMRKALTRPGAKLRESFTEHDIRAHTANEAERSGNIKRAQELLEHANEKTTAIYLRGRTPIRVRPLR